MAQTSAQGNHSARVTSVHFSSQAKPPSEAIQARLSQEDQILLTRLLSEKLSFIDHVAFDQPGIEEFLFGNPAIQFSRNRTDKASIPKSNSFGADSTTRYSDEARLFMRYNYSRREVIRILAGSAGVRLSLDATTRLLLWAHRALDSRNTLVRLHFPLVMAMAKRSRFSTIDFNGMLSEGNLTLLRTVENFDCSRGFKFSTYSCRSILKSFSRAASRANRFRNEISMEFDPVNERNNGVELQRATMEESCADELNDILVRNLAGLSPIEHQVITERFAIGKFALEHRPKPKTLKQVGALIGVTKERVRQIQNKAIKKLRSALEVHYLAA